MDTNSIKLDIETLKKLLPYALIIGVILGVIASLNINWGGLFEIILLCSWIFCGGLYANRSLSLKKSSLLNIAVNGAIVSAITELIFDVLSGILASIRFRTFANFFTLYIFIEAVIVGALGGVAWFVYKTNKK